MTSDTFTLEDRTSTALAWTDLLQHLSSRCHTERGATLALALPFLSDRQSVELELELVAEARACHDADDPLPFGSIHSGLEVALMRLEKEGALEGSTLVQIAETLKAGARLARFLRARLDEAPGLCGLAARLSPLDDISGPIFDAFDERGELVDHASPDLGRLRRRVFDLHDKLTARMRGLMEEPRIQKHLQDKFYTQREERYVLPVRTDSGAAVKGIVHGSSASGATMFVEPEAAVSLNNELKVAEMEVTREELRVLIELSQLVAEETSAIRANLDLLRRLDVIDARALLAIELGAHPPRVSDDGQIRLQAVRHPLMVLGGMEVVANDMELSANKVLIVTGPNAGGKTVCLKTLGLCALMLRAGMHLPAGADSRMPLFDLLLCEMGDDQSIEHNLSTFTAHLGHLLDYLERARPGALLLLDEIAIGTDPGEGAALAQALLEAFAESGAQTVVTTHYERLKSLPISAPCFANASVGFDMERMRPTYRLHQGTPGSSGALAVARRLGLSPQLADRAGELLDRGGEQLAGLLTALAGERTALEEQRVSMERAAAEAQALAAQHRRELEQLEQRERKALDGAHGQALDELKRARTELERVRALLRRPPDKERLKQADRQISAASATIRSHEPNRSPPKGKVPSAAELLPGTRVIVSKLGGQGQVIAPPSRGKVQVRVGGLKTVVKLTEVLLPPPGSDKRPKRDSPPKRPKRDQPDHRQAFGPGGGGGTLPANRAPVRTAYNTLDLRGFRVDDAIAEVEKFLDSALRAEEEVLMIIHGHGTGALRSALRTYLAGVDLVERFNAAPPEDGGEGVTVIWMR